MQVTTNRKTDKTTKRFSRSSVSPSSKLTSQIQTGNCSYQIRPGDSLWKIAQVVLGNGNRFLDIFRLNPFIKSVNTIHTGTVLSVCN